ncbi:barstar family protein [Leptospira neocaledonica]|uniref:Barstar (barnase inhibitor) domain-containing protein n=1 Tax=Leptospira neocaledonica TaxID=2023192 RepID=A0A2M9ZT46_9LEPT|nr:barstar family protein [Leptospira neocaledonica]PJZ75267.1 hypothetical protein CH365_19775 [Leptospira neocaledonica]
MSIFIEPWNDQNIDWLLLQNGATNLYLDTKILEEHIKELSELNYDIFKLNADNWESEADFHISVSHNLSFPDYYGENLSAFQDCISDIESKNSGTVLLFINYDTFSTKNREFAHRVLDILEYESRNLLLIGQRLIVIVKVHDAKFSVSNLGSRSANWNHKEWLNKDRGL